MKLSKTLLIALLSAPLGIVLAQDAADVLAQDAAVALAQDAADAYGDARRALNRQQFDDAIAAFRELRRDYPDSSYVADAYYWEAFALERSGDLERAVEVIDELLRGYPDASAVNDARALRVQVCSSLARRGDGDCAELVSSTVRDPSELDSTMRMAAVNALMNMRADRAIPIATEVVTNRNQPVAVRTQALFVLADKAGNTNDGAARDVLRRVALDETENRELRAQAIFWLSEVRGEDTLDLLTEILDGVADRELKNRAIFAISQHKDPAAMTLLRQYAESADLDTELRKQAIFWIGEEGGEQALPFLTGLYGSLDDSELRRQVLFAVAETRADGSTDWLLERARDEAERVEVRKQALFWAAEAGLSIDDLNALYEDFEDRQLREHLIWLISDHGGEGSLESLLDIARNDPTPTLREKAVFWIGDSDDPRAAEYLLQLLEE